MAEIDQRKLERLGEQLDLLYRFDKTFIHYVGILGKVCACRNLFPLLQEHIGEDDLQRILLLMDFLRHCSDLIEEPNR